MRKFFVWMLALGLVANCSDDDHIDRPQPEAPQCGNDRVEAGEFCDFGQENGNGLCPSDCTVPKAGWARCEENPMADCPDLPPVDPEDLVGMTFVYTCFIDGRVMEPTGLAPIMKGLIECSEVPSLAWRIQGYDSANDSLRMIGGILSRDGEFIEETGSRVAIPPVDFRHNPYLEFPFAVKFYFQVDQFLFSIRNVSISGWIDLDDRTWVGGEFRGQIDSEPFQSNLLGSICDFSPGSCDSDGYLPIIVHHLEAVELPSAQP